MKKQSYPLQPVLLRIFFLIVFPLYFQSCTAWPGFMAVLGALGGSKGGGGMLLVPGGGDAAAGSSQASTTSASCMAAAAAGTPQVISVNSDKVNGSYKAGTAIIVKLIFSEAVSVNTAGGTPSLLLNNNKTINYSGTVSTTNVANDTVEFSYTVGALEDIAPLDYKAATSLALNGGTIKSTAGALNNAITTLNAPGTPCDTSLVKNKTINIDTKAPSLTNITSTMNDGAANTYGKDAVITIDVTFDEIVNVTGTPTLTIALTAGGPGTATYASGTGTTTLRFNYTVLAGQTSTDLNVSAFNPTAGGATVLDVATNATGTTLPATNLANNKDLNVDGDAKTVSFVATTSNGSEATTSVNIPVSISAAPTTGTLTVTYSVTGGTATGSGTDFTLATGTLSWVIGDNANKNIALTISNDALDESDETVIITLSSPTGGALGTNTAHTYTINDDDPTPTVQFTAAAQSSTDETGTLTITAQLSAASGLAVTVPFTINGSSTATGGGTDYSISASPISIPAGSTTGTATITIAGDTIDEVNETIVVNMGVATNATAAGTTTHTATITDDDNPPTVQFTAASQASAGESGTMTITAQLSTVSSFAVSVPFSVNGSSTATGADYGISASPITIAAGATTGTATITITGDTIDENNETVVVDMGVPTNATASGTTTHTATITDDDNPPTVQFTAASQSSVGESGTLTITAQLSTASGLPVTVPFTVNASSTASGADYSISASPISIAAGATTGTATITITADTTDEANETVVVDIGTPTNATASGTTTHTATITDDDAAPTLSIDSPSITEGNAGTKNLTFTVTLSAASGQTVSVNYATADGTATTADSDYTAISSTALTFTAGQTSKTIDVSLNGDAKDENNETFTVTLSGPTNASIATGTGTGTITNDDTAPTISIDSPSVNEGNAGSTTLAYTVTLSAASGKTITVDYATADGTATTADTDYTAITTTTLTFTAGQTSKTVNVTVAGDTKDENNETLTVGLTNPSNATIAAATGTGTITNDDTAPTLSIDNQSTTEGNAGTKTVTFTVTLSAVSGKTVTVNYATADGTATTANSDYVGISSTGLTYTPGQTTKTFTVTINGDTTLETDETFTVGLSGASNATIATATGTGTITNDEAVPSLSIDSPSVAEGNAGTKTLTFTVTLSTSSPLTTTVNYATADGTATTADSDYTAISSTTLTFTPGQTSKTVDVTLNGDTKDENNETFTVTLSSPANATIGTATGTGTITNDDTPPSLSINSRTTAEGNSGSTNETFTVTLSAASGKTITVDYATANVTATSGADYTSTTGTLTFNAGDTSKTITVPVLGDTTDEVDETYSVTLSNVSATATIATATGTGTITDDDAAPTIAFDATTSNGSEATTAVNIPVSLSVASGLTVTVNYAVSGGTATGSGTDYTLASGTLTFNPGDTTKNIAVTVVNDTSTELNETIIVDISSPSNANLGANTSHTYTINDNDAPTVAFNATTSNGAEATTAVNLPVSLSAAYGQTVTVNYSVTGGTATGSGTDFTLASGTLTFNSGTTSQNIAVTIVNDASTELNETIIVTLATPSNATLGTNTAHTYTINDDDAPTVAFNATTSNGSEATTAVTIPVSLSAAYGSTVTVNYSVTGGTATGSGTDYTLASGTLTFNSGTTSQDISVTVVNDTATELNETIQITLATPSGATLGTNTVHTYTINDNDGPTVAFDATTSNGSEATTAVTIPVSLSAAYGSTVTVDYSVTGGTATGSGTDFTLASGTLTFNSGTTTQNISVTVVNDASTELNETIQITLATPSGATLGTNTVHTYTITDNDPPTVAFNATTSNGGESTTSVNLPVSLSAAYGQTVTVNYSVTGGTATGSGTDFTLASGTLTFTSGTTSQNIAVTIVNDSTTEVNETIIVTLATPSNASLGANTAHTYTINDDDAPTVAFNATTSNGSEATTAVTIPVSLSAAYGSSVTVDYAVTGGTATGSGTDYTLASGTLTFTSGTTSQNISVTVVNDALNEADETIIVTLSNQTNSTLGANTAHTYTITDNDTAPTVYFAAASSNSTDESSTTRTITVSLSSASGQTVTVTATDSGGTATSGTDYTAIGSPLTVSISAGSTSQTISIPVTQDSNYEGNETILLTLSSPSNATLGAQTTHTFTIIDDDIGISSAETMDFDNNGKIDHYKITFSEAVNDSSFPGYLANSLGNAQVNWLIAGYTNVVLAHGTAAPTADTANDNIIYLKFTESGSFDTDIKPNLTTTATPGLSASNGHILNQVFTATVTEADRAKPVIVSATGDSLSANLTVTFSEAVWGNTGMPACGSGGQLLTTAITYNNASASGATSISSMGADTCGSVDKNAIFVADISFTSGDNAVDTVAGATVYDAADNIGNTTPKTLSITAGPTISIIQQFDTNKNGKIDQLRILFTTNMNDTTIDDADAARFVIGGNAATKVDTASSGTGTIANPNTDPGTANDSIVTIFTDDFSISGTDKKSVSFTLNSGRWMGNGIELQTNADLSSVTEDKAPPVILTAVAAENANAAAGVDSDDTLVLTFSEPTNKPSITNGNISSVFSLTPATHVWGTITSTSWNVAGDQLTINFAGSGTTVAVGDYITILGTIADNATSPNTSTNIQSVNPVSGDFNVQAPSISSASSTSATTLRVVFTENVNNTEAVNTANYKIALSSAATGTCADNSNFTGSTGVLSISGIVKVDDKTYDFTTASQTNGTSYTLITDKSNIHHKDYSTYTITCPNNANFIGQEKLRITNVSCSSLSSVVITFSKPVNTGMNIAGSAECNTTTECDKRYSIKGIISGTEIGSLSQAKVLDGTVCSGQAASTSKVCLTHTLNQNGSIYTLVAANNTDSDGFDNSSWGAIQSSAENLQASPKDRASFLGCGNGPHNFIDGPVITDPFGDGTVFGYLNKYQSKIYIGPNQKGNGATRFEADGSSPENLTFELLKDSTGSRVSSSTASAPFMGIGYTGCTSNNATGIGCGPNNENGRGLFATGTFSGTEYLFITGANTAGNNDYLYYTSDLDSVLNFNYMDASWTFDNYTASCSGTWSSSVTQNQVTESIHIFNGKVYWSVPGDGTNRPFAVKIGSLTGEVTCDNTNNSYMNMRYMSGVGRLHATKPAQADIMGGVFNSFSDRVYFANSGSISYNKSSTPTCIEGSTYSAGICEQTGGIVRSINNNPAGCTSAGGCPDWLDITPSSTDYKKYFTIGLEAITDLIPAQRPVPAMETYKGNFYIIRNACTQALWDDGTAAGGDSNNGCGFSSSCGTTNKNDKTCPVGSEIPQLWKCDPTTTGSATECDSGDWVLVAQSGTTGKTNFGDTNNKKVTMLSTNGDYLYVGFDNSSTGIEVWRTNVSSPSTEADFSQIGGDGFGSGNSITEIYSNISLQSGSIYYLYLSIGKNNIPVRVHRQQNN